MRDRQNKIEQRKDEDTSLQESLALKVVLEACSDFREEKLSSVEALQFLPDTLSLVSKVASIYYPDERAPMERARIGDVLSAFLDMNQQILAVLDLSGLEALAQFRLREVFPGQVTNKESRGSPWVPDFLLRRIRLMVLRALWVQWLLLVGESAIKVYGGHSTDEIPEPEILLDEMDQLPEETDLSLPDEVRDIVEASRKNIMFSIKPLPWNKVKPIYVSLAENIARFWHPRSLAPLYEVRLYDLLSGLADYLEWAGELSQKPVLNKMVGLRVSHLTGVKEVAMPFTDNKLFDWVQKYQVGRAAKWSKTIFKTLQKKQPAILFRDVAMGLVKEGGKRWLFLYLHNKIAGETNKLYKVSPSLARDQDDSFFNK